MIPDISETIAMIERDLPGYDWLLRSISTDKRDTLRGQGTHFAHLFKRDSGFMLHSYKSTEGSAAAVLFAVYNEAMTSLSAH